MKLTEGCKIHPTFHISTLKIFKGDNPTKSRTEIPKLSIDNMVVPVPSAIIDRRVIVRQEKQVKQLLIQWSSSQLEDYTWEDLKSIQRLLPSLQLEDKVSVKGECYDRFILNLEVVEKDIKKWLAKEIQEEEITLTYMEELKILVKMIPQT